MRQEVIESVLDSFEDQPSNLTMIQEYERMAKTHLNNYLEALLENKAKKLPEDQGNLLMGIVKTRPLEGVDLEGCTYVLKDTIVAPFVCIHMFSSQ